MHPGRRIDEPVLTLIGTSLIAAIAFMVGKVEIARIVFRYATYPVGIGVVPGNKVHGIAKLCPGSTTVSRYLLILGLGAVEGLGITEG